MALDFPANPTDGQAYGAYVWSATKGVWLSREESAAVTVVSPTAPLSANPGDLWLNSSSNILFAYYSDGTSSQWVEVITSSVLDISGKADKTYVDSKDALKANLDSPTFSGTVSLPSTTSIGNVSSTELSYIDGVTSSVQTQLSAKLPISGGTMTGYIIGRPNTGGTVYASNGTGSFEVTGSSTQAASMSFHRPGVQAMNMGLDTDNIFKIGGYSWGDRRWSVDANGGTYQPGNIVLEGSIGHNYWRTDLNRAWDNYPSITVYNTTDKGPQGEFRIHGYPGSNGGDFSIATRSDGGFITGSDARRKTNIEEISNALQIINGISGKRFNIINSEGTIQEDLSNEDTGKKFGLIAQEVEDLIPEAVKHYPEAEQENENGYASAYSIDYSSLVPLLIQGINELTQKVSELEARLNVS